MNHTDSLTNRRFALEQTDDYCYQAPDPTTNLSQHFTDNGARSKVMFERMLMSEWGSAGDGRIPLFGSLSRLRGWKLQRWSGLGASLLCLLPACHWGKVLKAALGPLSWSRAFLKRSSLWKAALNCNSVNVCKASLSSFMTPLSLQWPKQINGFSVRSLIIPLKAAKVGKFIIRRRVLEINCDIFFKFSCQKSANMWRFFLKDV